VKKFGLSPEIATHLLIARGVFAAAHFLFFSILLKTGVSIGNYEISNEAKLASRNELKKLFNSFIVRALIVFAIHFKVGILPPLFVSSVMGVFSILENDDTHKELKKMFPSWF
jgi:hypothetical protein